MDKDKGEKEEEKKAKGEKEEKDTKEAEKKEEEKEEEGEERRVAVGSTTTTFTTCGEDPVAQPTSKTPVVPAGDPDNTQRRGPVPQEDTASPRTRSAGSLVPGTNSLSSFQQQISGAPRDKGREQQQREEGEGEEAQHIRIGYNVAGAYVEMTATPPSYHLAPPPLYHLVRPTLWNSHHAENVLRNTRDTEIGVIDNQNAAIALPFAADSHDRETKKTDPSVLCQIIPPIPSHPSSVPENVDKRGSRASRGNHYLSPLFWASYRQR